MFKKIGSGVAATALIVVGCTNELDDDPGEDIASTESVETPNTERELESSETQEPGGNGAGTSGSGEGTHVFAANLGRWVESQWVPDYGSGEGIPCISEEENPDGSLTLTLLPPDNLHDAGPSDSPYAAFETYLPSGDFDDYEAHFMPLEDNIDLRYTIPASVLDTIKRGRSSGITGGYGASILNIPPGYELPQVGKVDDQEYSPNPASVATRAILRDEGIRTPEQAGANRSDEEKEAFGAAYSAILNSLRLCAYTGFEMRNDALSSHKFITNLEDYRAENRHASTDDSADSTESMVTEDGAPSDEVTDNTRANNICPEISSVEYAPSAYLDVAVTGEPNEEAAGPVALIASQTWEGGGGVTEELNSFHARTVHGHDDWPRAYFNLAVGGPSLARAIDDGPSDPENLSCQVSGGLLERRAYR